MRAAGMTWLVVIALSLAACAGTASSAAPGAPATLSTNPVAATVATDSSSSPMPSPAGPGTYDRSDAELRAGTYAATRFRFPFTAEIDTDLGIRDAGDSSRFVYIGQDKNAPVNGDEEFDAMVLERVLDPVDQRTLRPLSGDVYRWFTDHPRLRAVAGSERTLTVDGDAARAVDLLVVDPAPCGSAHANLLCVQIGYGPESDEPFSVFDGSRVRIVVVDHAPTEIVFAYQAADDSRFGARAGVFDRWVESVQFQ